MIGEVNFGQYVGKDGNGNKYYEDRNRVFGTHRWVEYKDIHNFDSSTVTPDWHGWLHHMQDTPPNQTADPRRHELTASQDDCPYETHVGQQASKVLNQNPTGFRPRGYGVGNLFQKWGEPELYYKQVRACSHAQYAG
jgi:NADH:ubiquinone oxidoreductase subunit